MNLFSALLSPVAIGSYVVLFGVLAYKLIFEDSKKLKDGKLIRCFLYERIGENLVYEKIIIGEERKDDKLGAYIYLKSLKVGIERLSNEDFFQDKKYGKCLNLVKYSEDDYRPLIKLKNTFYKKEKEIIKEEVLVENEDTSEEYYQVIAKKDENGNIMYKDVEKEYNEPLGITQEGRAAMRFNLKYQKRMQELFGEKKGFWENILPYASLGLVAVILMISFVYMNNTHSDTMLELSATFDENAKAQLEEMQQPHFAERLLETIQNKDKEANAPPK